MMKISPAVVASLAFIALNGAQAQVTVDERIAPGQPPVIIAQRALGGGHPENSLGGIRYAIENGVDMVKIDVQLTSDGQHILMHDPELTRTTNVRDVYPDRSHFVGDFTVEEIKQLRLQHGEDGGELQVPTLKEALDLIGSDILVAIGLKSYDLEELVGTLAARPTGNVLLFFAEPGALHSVVEASSATGVRVFAGFSRTGNYSENLVRLSDALGQNFALMGLSRKAITPELVETAAELGVGLSVFGLRDQDHALMSEEDPSDWLDALQSGAAAMLTAFPVEVLALTGR